MKITINQYAKTLYAATREKSKKETAEIVSNFVKILVRSNQLKNGRKIIKKLNEIYDQENGIIEAEIISAQALSNELRNKLRNYLKDKYQAKEVIFKNIIDEKIKGGVVIRVGDEVLDASVARQLREIKSILAK